MTAWSGRRCRRPSPGPCDRARSESCHGMLRRVLHWSVCGQSRRTTGRLGCIGPAYCYAIEGAAQLALGGSEGTALSPPPSRTTRPGLVCGPDGAAGGRARLDPARARIDPAASGLDDHAAFGSGPTRLCDARDSDARDSDARDSELTCVQSQRRGTGQYFVHVTASLCLAVKAEARAGILSYL